MQKRIRRVLSTTIVAFGLAGAPVLAQQTTAQPMAPADTMPAQSYTDTQLQNFIKASERVVMISQEYTPRIEATTDQQEREQIFREADEEMVAAVQDEGLSVQDFNTINQQLPQDPQLEQRVTEMLE